MSLGALSSVCSSGINVTQAEIDLQGHSSNEVTMSAVGKTLVL